MVESWQFRQMRVVTSGARPSGIGPAHLAGHLGIGGAVHNSHRNSERNQAGRIGRGVTLRMLLGPAPEQITGGSVAQPLTVAGFQIADRGQPYYPADPRPRIRVHVPRNLRREQLPARGPEG